MKRMPAVAGHFYPGSAVQLKSQIQEFGSINKPRKRVIGIVVPHAGYIYSGRVAAAVYNHIEFPDTFILLGPNHTGIGSDLALFCSGSWEIPGRSVDIDEALCSALKTSSPLFTDDEGAHTFEHSLEVQLPFIAYESDDIKIVPVTVSRADIDDCRSAGIAIAKTISESSRRVVIAASTDMSHYLDHDATLKLDKLAIDRILALDPEGLYNVVRTNNISMCGMLPAAIMLFAAKELGASDAELVMHATSGEVSGDFDRVVGYAGLIIR
ncbi:MAG: AmmeMemoRadiSam system protein B [Nitrospirae bacterium]|nr:AmmeMemoRadiSam system protein B [Nitrospirota bacterium]